MGTRLDLHALLVSILDSRNVYYQPPNNVHMEYPAIVYEREDIENAFANNNVYAQGNVYSVTVIDEDPDSEIVQKVSKLPTAKFNRHFTSDNLNHDVFTLHY